MRKKMGLFVLMFAGALCACGTSNQGAGIPTSDNQMMTEHRNVDEPNIPIVPGADVLVDPTEAVVEIANADNNMNTSQGQIYADGDGAFLWQLSKDGRKQGLFYVGNGKNDTVRAIYDMAADDPASSELSCGYMTGYGDTLVFLESNSQNEDHIVHYVTKDGQKNGIIGTFSGRFLYGFTAGFKVNDKVYYITDANDIFEVDIKNRSLTKFDPGIQATAGNDFLILGVREDGTYYMEYNDKDGIIGVFVCDSKTRQSKMISKLPMDVEHIELVGDYILYYDGKDKDEGGTSSVYSIHIPTAQKNKLFKIEDFDLYFRDGDFHVSGDMVYYLRSGKDLYGCTIKGEDHKLLVSFGSDDERKNMLASSGDWLFYRSEDDFGEHVFRMKKDDTSFAANPILP